MKNLLVIYFLLSYSNFNISFLSYLFFQTISLEVVNLKNCKRISNRSFDNFGMRRVGGREREIEKERESRKVINMNTACSSLSHLNINFCEKVSTNSLLIVMAISENLHTIKAFKIKIRGNRYKFSDFIKRYLLSLHSPHFFFFLSFCLLFYLLSTQILTAANK